MTPPKNRAEVREKPRQRPIMYQNWCNLLFLHWEYDPHELQKSLPPGLHVDTFENKGYLSIVALFIKKSRFAGLPAMPGFSDFIEVNLRTYVYDENGVPGVWFYSLDIDSLIATKSARYMVKLPYFFAEFRQDRIGEQITIQGSRLEKPDLELRFTYLPAQQNVKIAKEETLEFFLIERYVFFSHAAHQLYLGRVYHQPYSITEVEIKELHHTYWQTYGFDLSGKPPQLIQYCPKVDVEIFQIKKDIF